MYSLWSIHLAECRKKHAPDQWEAFKIPLKLLGRPHSNHQSSGLLSLPNELLLQILLNNNSVCRLFLALTCKRLLVVSSMTAIRIPSAPKHRDCGLNCPAMLAILRSVCPMNSSGRPKRSWAPCCVCYRYRPKRKSFWKCAEQLYPKETACQILVGYDSILQSWSSSGSISYQCPDCWCKERIAMYGHLVK